MRMYKFNRYFINLFIIFNFIIGFMGASFAWAEPKNVIFLIGDGMGFEQVKAAGMYDNGSIGTLIFESFPYQAEVTTYSADSSITDSAAAATAIATGIKVNNGVISKAIPGDGSELYTILEHARDIGKRTGLVTNVVMTHATPAAFGAHESSRDNYVEIGQDYLQSLPNVLFGGGSNGLSVVDAEAAGYTVVIDYSELQNLNTETVTQVYGHFGYRNMPYEYDYSAGFINDYDTLPHLSEMTSAALDILDNDPDGFFLMIEGGKIDHAGHLNDIERNIFETIEFENAIQTVMDWAQGRSDTLILVTADHETGGLLVTQNNGQGAFPDVTWSTTGHTGDNVGIYAIGENAQMFTGTLDNTDIYGKATATTSDFIEYYCDDDQDYYFSSIVSGSCTGIGCQPLGCGTAAGSDCDDTDPVINPDTLWYEDSDGDGYGNPTVAYVQCTQPVEPPDYVLDKLDYDDSDPNIGPPVKITGSATSYHFTLQAAYDHASDGDTIKVISESFTEDLSVDIIKSVVFSGGYDGAFATFTENTTLNGEIDVSIGTLTIENFILQ